jgi:hypothetical protein
MSKSKIKRTFYLDPSQDRRFYQLKLDLAPYGFDAPDSSAIVRTVFELFEELRTGPTGPLVMRSFAHTLQRDLEAKGERDGRKKRTK